MLINSYRFAAASTPWTPAQITTALWLDAADVATISPSGGPVSQWNDKSGNGRNALQATSANRPAYTVAGQNGLNVLTLDGSNDSLALAADLSIATEHTIFVAAANSATITASTTGQQLLSGSGYTYPSTTTSELLLGAGSLTGNLTNERLYSVVLAHDTSGPNVYGFAKTGTDVSGGFFLSSAFATTSNAFTGRLNGSADFASTSSAGGYSSTSTRYPSAVRGIGYRFSNSASYWSGQIWEIIVAPSYLSLAGTQLIEGYLAHKWGLTANLPADHPYKSAAPTAPYDADAQTYFNKVEQADGNVPLETATKDAINAFVVGCKNDGIWNAIKASCILAGARTLAGALTPLVGTAPSNVGPFVSGDYNRKTGLVGNGSSKYLNSNRNNNADPQDSKHLSVYATVAATSISSTFPAYIGSANSSSPFDSSLIARDASNGQLYARLNAANYSFIGAGSATGLLAINRAASNSWSSRVQQSPGSYLQSSTSNRSEPIAVFNTGTGVSTVNSIAYSNARLAFYSIGESLDLALLDTRVTALMAAFSTAIPWTPAQITTALWLDAADASTVTAPGGVVSQWNDKSGNGRNASQATEANKPTYSATSFNGRPAISGDGINDVLLTATTPMYGQSSFYMHCVFERLETGSGVLLGNRSFNGNIARNFEFNLYENASVFSINASSLMLANGSGTNQNSVRSTPTNSLTNGFVGQAAMQWNTGQTPAAWINGASQALADWAAGASPNVTTTQVWDAVDPGLGIFNSSVGYSNAPAQCRIAEIIIINTSASTVDRQKLEGYLAHKWGLTASLPADHPYKTAAP